MARSDDLFLHEEIMLLALKDDKGTIEFGANYTHAVAGAVIAQEGRCGVEYHAGR